MPSAKKLTVSQAFKLYHDPKRGPLPGFSPHWQKLHARVRSLWLEHLGAGHPWDTIRRADVHAYAMRRLQRVGPRQVEIELKALQAVANWLVRYAELDVKNPTRGFDWRRLRKGHEPRRPRYTDEELAALADVAWDVDPRFGLFLALAVETGQRAGALRRLRRSHIDRAHPKGVSDVAPHGWIVFSADLMKAGAETVVYLTAEARAALKRAWDGHLRERERAWIMEGTDYPLFPAELDPENPVDRRRLLDWLEEAESRARVPHVPGRGFHGIRRRVVDRLAEEGAPPDVLQAAGGWRSPQMALAVYREQGSKAALGRVRELMEKWSHGRGFSEEEREEFTREVVYLLGGRQPQGLARSLLDALFATAEPLGAETAWAARTVLGHLLSLLNYELLPEDANPIDGWNPYPRAVAEMLEEAARLAGREPSRPWDEPPPELDVPDGLTYTLPGNGANVFVWEVARPLTASVLAQLAALGAQDWHVEVAAGAGLWLPGFPVVVRLSREPIPHSAP